MATTLSTPEVDLATKHRFAKAFLRTNNASAAAMEALPFDIGMKLMLSNSLPSDPDVLLEMDRIREEVGEMSLLPSKAAIARKILDKAELTGNVEDYANLMKLYCSVVGFIEKPGTNVNVDNRTVQNVMVVTSHGDDSEWEAKAAEQQKRLTLNATV